MNWVILLPSNSPVAFHYALNEVDIICTWSCIIYPLVSFLCSLCYSHIDFYFHFLKRSVSLFPILGTSCVFFFVGLGGGDLFYLVAPDFSVSVYHPKEFLLCLKVASSLIIVLSQCPVNFRGLNTIHFYIHLFTCLLSFKKSL